LRQVIDFYNRGGDFANTDEFDPNVHPLRMAPGADSADRNALVAFLMALTDERVAYEREPFDHPGICVANGAAVTPSGALEVGRQLPGGGTQLRAEDNLKCFAATGARGRAERLKPFMNVNQFSPTP
jgi:hypothetical protein